MEMMIETTIPFTERHQDRTWRLGGFGIPLPSEHWSGNPWQKKIRQFHLGKKRDPGRQVPFLVLHCKRKEHPSTKSSQHFISLKEKSCYRLDVVDGVGNYPLVLKHGAGWKLPPFIYIYIFIFIDICTRLDTHYPIFRQFPMPLPGLVARGTQIPRWNQPRLWTNFDFCCTPYRRNMLFLKYYRYINQNSIIKKFTNPALMFNDFNSCVDATI